MVRARRWRRIYRSLARAEFQIVKRNFPREIVTDADLFCLWWETGRRRKDYAIRLRFYPGFGVAARSNLQRFSDVPEKSRDSRVPKKVDRRQ